MVYHHQNQYWTAIMFVQLWYHSTATQFAGLVVGLETVTHNHLHQKSLPPRQKNHQHLACVSHQTTHHPGAVLLASYFVSGQPVPFPLDEAEEELKQRLLNGTQVIIREGLLANQGCS